VTARLRMPASDRKLKVGIVGLGKMGISHLAIAGAHPEVTVTAICDQSAAVVGVLSRFAKLPSFSDYDDMLAHAEVDAVIIATPSQTHVPLAAAALSRRLHVFCEKPLALSSKEALDLTAMANAAGVVTHVGYHNRFVATFQEAKSLVEAGAIGPITHGLAEAYGPVVLKAKRNRTWRTRRDQGGGCLYDYAAHPVDLLNWLLGSATEVAGSKLQRIFSRDSEDQVLSTLSYGRDCTALLSVNWSDESQRKMTTRISLWGPAGRIFVDRQECQLYLGEATSPPRGYRRGWNVKYTTELSRPVGFYLRGEEYSVQMDSFVSRALSGEPAAVSDFASAAETDRVLEMIARDAGRIAGDEAGAAPGPDSSEAAGGVRGPGTTRANRTRQAVRGIRRRRRS
jgi:scyllo-inositol 2-dehydrogenase (NADP+)